MVNPNHFLTTRAYSCTFIYYYMLELLLSLSLSYSSIPESKSPLIVLLLPWLSLSAVFSTSIDNKSNLHAQTASLFHLVGKSFWFDSVFVSSPLLSLTSNCPKFGLYLHRCNYVRVCLYAHPQHMKVLKHFIYIQYGHEKQSRVVYSLQTWHHDVTWTLPFPHFSKLAPTTCIGVNL